MRRRLALRRGLSRAVFSTFALLALGATNRAFAHHSPGHAGSESLRTLASTGSEPVPRQRVALVGEYVKTSPEPTLNAASQGTLSVLGTLRLAPRVLVGAQAPFVLVAEDRAEGASAGYGDTRLSGFVTLGDPSETRTTWTLGANVTLPTRTIRYSADPGAQWLFSPLVSFSTASPKFRAFFMVLTPLEIRPAGLALEISPSVGVAYRVTPRFSTSFALGADVRLLSFCTGPRGAEFCEQGRASERERSIGSTRVYGAITNWLGLTDTWSLFGSGQLPLTDARDFAFGLNLGVEARF